MSGNDPRVVPLAASDWPALRELALIADDGPMCPSLGDIAAGHGGGTEFWRTRVAHMRGPGRLAAFVQEGWIRTGFVSAYVDGEGREAHVVVRHVLLREGVSCRAVDRLLDTVESWAREEGAGEVLMEVCCGQDGFAEALRRRGYHRGEPRPAAHPVVVDGVSRIAPAVEWSRRAPAVRLGPRCHVVAAS